MSTVFTLFMVLIIAVCVLLIIIIMAQNPKGGGLSGTFGGGASSASYGVQRTNDFMEKATWTLGIAVVVLIILSVALTAKPTVNVAPVAAPKKELPNASQAPTQKIDLNKNTTPDTKVEK